MLNDGQQPNLPFLYDAFISYRHVERDRKWAEWLIDALERFRVPQSLQKKGCPGRLRKIFRDEDEVPASADLNDQIKQALIASRYLIVVCSAFTPRSKWVEREIEMFNELGRGDQVLALLTEGEPGDSFPAAMLELRREDGVEDALAVFDYKISALGKGVQDEGRSVPFAAKWLVASSKYAAPALEIGPEGPPEGIWDFAVVRLAEPVGAQALGPDPAASAERRGRYRLNGGPYAFEQAEPILILGHPVGRPMQFSYASPSGARETTHGNRVRYKTNTGGGSSGSPVFNCDWRIVALHHAAGPRKCLATSTYRRPATIKAFPFQVSSAN
jgi:hypothetical protein